MPLPWESSLKRFHQYKRDLAAHKTEGSRRSIHAPDQSNRRHRTFSQLFGSFWSLLHGRRKTTIICLLMVTLGTAVKLVPPFGMGVVVDYALGGKVLPSVIGSRFASPPEPQAIITVVAVIIIIAALIAVIVGITGRWLATLTTKRVQTNVRRKLFAHAVRLPLHRIYQLKSGGAASILREDAGGIAELVFSMLYNPWRAIVQLFGTIIILAWIDWRLLIGSLVVIPTVFLTHRTWISRIRPLWRDIRHTRQQIDAHAAEAFGGMRVVRSFGRQRTETGRFIRNNHLMIRQEILAWLWSRSVDVAWSILIPMATAALLWYGGWRILSDRELVAAGMLSASQALTIGDLLMFLLYLGYLLEPLATLATSATSFQNSLAGLDRVLDVLAEPMEMQSTPGSIRLNPVSVEAAIRLNNVTFAYPGTKREVIENVTMEIEAGQMIALVGSSGAGKTTLTNLIARFYDPDQGVIELDGVDLRDIEVESYRRLLGIVEQDIFLFDGSIAGNIGYGGRGASMDDIQHAAQRANAHDFISEFERGYDTFIGERGVRLSGGQRQRIAIARAMLADPRILILDEATSNLDTESERLIQSSLAGLMTGRTSIVIAHRLSTVMHADNIIVMDHGRIIERGTHKELMASSGRYERMIRLQFTPPTEDLIQEIDSVSV